MDRRSARLRQLRRIVILTEGERRKRRLVAFTAMYKTSQSQRNWWVHPLNSERTEKGEIYTLYPSLRHYKEHFFNYYRMTPKKFDELLQLVGPYIEKKWTNMREPLSPEFKLVLTLT